MEAESENPVLPVAWCVTEGCLVKRLLVLKPPSCVGVGTFFGSPDVLRREERRCLIRGGLSAPSWNHAEGAFLNRDVELVLFVLRGVMRAAATTVSCLCLHNSIHNYYNSIPNRLGPLFTVFKFPEMLVLFCVVYPSSFWFHGAFFPPRLNI